MRVDDVSLSFNKSKIVQDTEEQPLKISIGTSNGEVFILYSKPVTGLRFTKKEAREYAARIVKEALK